MKGLDRIIERIGSDADAECAEMMSAAKAEAERIRAEYDERISQIESDFADRTEHEAEAIITRAKSSASMTRRNIISGARSRGVDKAFEEALAKLYSLPRDEYASLLVALSASAVKSHVDRAEEKRERYGEDTGHVQFEIVLNARDREELGETVVLAVKNTSKRALGADAVRRIMLSESTANIDGGVIVRAGQVEENCSFSLLVDSLHDTLDPIVYKTLFPENN